MLVAGSLAHTWLSSKALRTRSISSPTIPPRADIILFTDAGGDQYTEPIHNLVYQRYRWKCFIFSEADCPIPLLPGIYASIPKKAVRQKLVQIRDAGGNISLSVFIFCVGRILSRCSEKQQSLSSHKDNRRWNNHLHAIIVRSEQLRNRFSCGVTPSFDAQDRRPASAKI
jgi:hypothetical protein